MHALATIGMRFADHLSAHIFARPADIIVALAIFRLLLSISIVQQGVMYLRRYARATMDTACAMVTCWYAAEWLRPVAYKGWTAYVEPRWVMFVLSILKTTPLIWASAVLVLLLVIFGVIKVKSALNGVTTRDSAPRDESLREPAVLGTLTASLETLTTALAKLATPVYHEPTTAPVPGIMELLRELKEFRRAMQEDFQIFAKTVALTLPSAAVVSQTVEGAVSRTLGDIGVHQSPRKPDVVSPRQELMETSETILPPYSRKASCLSEADLLELEDEVEPTVLPVIGSWATQKQQTPSAPKQRTPITEEEIWKFATMTHEEVADYIRQKARERRQAQAPRKLTPEEKELTLDQLDQKWRVEDFERRQQQLAGDMLGKLTDAELELTVPEIRRIIRGRKQQRFFQKLQEKGLDVRRCETCGEVFAGSGTYRCVPTAWRLVGENKKLPVNEQFVITQKGTGALRLRKISAVDESRLQREYEAIQAAKRRAEEREAQARVLLPAAPAPEAMIDEETTVVPQPTLSTPEPVTTASTTKEEPPYITLDEDEVSIACVVDGKTSLQRTALVTAANLPSSRSSFRRGPRQRS